jgi:hypothetical protein
MALDEVDSAAGIVLFQAMDPYWQSTFEFLSAHFAPGDPLVIPDLWTPIWTAALAANETEDRNPADYRAVVIHKGNFEAFAPRFLRRVLQTFRPRFANEVFVVMVAADAVADTMEPAPSHLQSLRQMEQWVRFQSSPGPAYGVVGRPLSNGELLARMSRFIRRKLVKPIGGSNHIALSETQHTFNNTDWFWVDDTAKAAEMLCVPSLRAEDPAMTDRLIDLIVDMSRGPFIHRRVSPPALRVEQSDPADFLINNAFSILHGDLTAGKVFVAIRYNDGRTRPLTCLTSNVVSARWRGRLHSCVVERNIVSHELVQSGDEVVLRYTARLPAANDHDLTLAHVTYSYTLRAAGIDVGVDIRVDPVPDKLLHNVKLTATFGELGHHSSIDRARFLRGSGTRQTFSPKPGHQKLTRQPFQYVSLDESRGSPGFATGLHVMLLNPDRLIEVAANANGEGHFGEVSNLYRQRWAASWRPFAIAEIRMVTGGGYYEYPEYYHGIMSRTAAIAAPIDPSMSYDLGAELNAIACYLRFAHSSQYEVDPPSAERLASLKAWFDRHLDIYFAHAPLEDQEQRYSIFVRGLAFVAIALDTVHSVYPEERYARLIVRSAQALLAIQRPVDGTTNGATLITSCANNPDVHPELDSHSAAMLALIRSLRHGTDCAAVTDAIVNGLRAIRIEPLPDGAPGQGRLTHPTLVFQRRVGGLVDSGYWTFKLGVSLRVPCDPLGFAAGLLDLEDATMRYLAELTKVARGALTHALVIEQDEIEILTSANSGETNSETQLWVALGLACATEPGCSTSMATLGWCFMTMVRSGWLELTLKSSVQ